MSMAPGLISLFEKFIDPKDKINAWQELLPHMDGELIEDLRTNKYFAQAFLEDNEQYDLLDDEGRAGIREAWGLPHE